MAPRLPNGSNDGPCKIDGCGTKARQRGMCAKHYERMRVHGDPLYLTPMAEDLTGTRWGRLLVVSRAADAARGVSQWLCACDCGKQTTVRAGNLKNGHTQSCGCLQTERRGAGKRTHGMTRTATYRSWVAMRRRCTDEDYIEFHLYGGRGIAVCSEWQADFARFYADMGERPVRHSLDRIDPDGHYEPANCRWATYSQQARNRRKVVR